MKTGVLLINLGTPDSPAVADVRRYLTQFLNDPRVIDTSALTRFLVVNLFIVPFRAPKSAKLYEAIWSKEGSPLLIHGNKVKEQLQKNLGDSFVVELGMRYQNPSLQEALDRLRKASVERIIVLPLYPQYASSSTGSSMDEMMRILQTWQVFPTLKIINKFYDREDFIKAWIKVAEKYDHQEYDHVLFSYHGLPERQIYKASANYGNYHCQLNSECCASITDANRYCYRAACYHTSRELAKHLGIPSSKYTVAFQSRLGKTPWIQPFSDEVVIRKAKEGVKKMLVFSPAFVADCLETIYEIGTEYQHLFEANGGGKIQLVESLNSHPAWIESLKNMVMENSADAEK